MWTSFAQLAGVVVAALSLAFAVTTQVRTSSQRRHAERAETAARLLASLEGIHVGGISPKLDDSLALKLHAEQIQGLQEIIRVNIAAFEKQAKRTGISLDLHFLVGFNGVLMLVVGSALVADISRIRVDQRWIAVLIATAIFTVGGVAILDVVLAVARRVTARAVRRRAGMYVPSALEIISRTHATFILWRGRRRVRESRVRR